MNSSACCIAVFTFSRHDRHILTMLPSDRSPGACRSITSMLAFLHMGHQPCTALFSFSSPTHVRHVDVSRPRIPLLNQLELLANTSLQRTQLLVGRLHNL